MRLAVLSLVPTLALAVHFSGQASGWLGFSLLPGGDTMRNHVPTIPAGLRCLPALDVEWRRLDAEASVNACALAQAYHRDSLVLEGHLKPYRLWLRYSTTQFEARAGLQKINFGSATLLRPLQWFDRLDPRDPLGMTDGVYGLLGRYYFQNNANLWAWGLLGNTSPKGREQIGSERWRPEFGGRAQLPVPRGEVAATYHHRRVVQEAPGLISRVADDRVGLDGKWDVGVGCWFEATLMRQGFGGSWQNAYWQRMATIGLDYTFGIGNGLAAVVEHTYTDAARGAFESEQRAQASAAMVSYPLGLLDNLRGIILYDWRNRAAFSHVGWQRSLDRWLFSVSAFWNPDTPAGLGVAGASAAGKGLQMMVVYNH
ncbi:hypothetical protein FJY69_07985 [candidate division WOR-3 bacterium]|nr:hypothetical protein [candidate division WOR-3 bacterium]